MKAMKYFLFFIFIFYIGLVSAYHAGEQINFNYTNITDTDYPCIFINSSYIYLAGDIDIGNQSCEITYYDYYEESESSSNNGGSSGGGGGVNLIPNCTYTECLNNKTIKMCVVSGYKYNTTTNCITNITKKIVPVIGIDKEVAIQQPQNNKVNVSLINESTKNSKVGIIIVVIIVIIGIVAFFIYQINKQNEVN